MIDFSSTNGYGRPPSRKNQPACSLYFIRDDNSLPPYKLSCPFCKRTIMDGVKGTLDKMVDGPVSAEDYDFACNLQCKLCCQKFRLLVNAKFPVDIDKLVAAPAPKFTEDGWQ